MRERGKQVREWDRGRKENKGVATGKDPERVALVYHEGGLVCK